MLSSLPMTDWEALAKERAARIEYLEARNRLLEQKLDALLRLYFGKKSEKLDPAQLELLLQEETSPGKPGESTGGGVAPVDVEKEAKTPNPPRQRKPRIPDNSRGQTFCRLSA